MMSEVVRIRQITHRDCEEKQIKCIRSKLVIKLLSKLVAFNELKLIVLVLPSSAQKMFFKGHVIKKYTFIYHFSSNKL